jgi:hypothetical protein
MGAQVGLKKPIVFITNYQKKQTLNLRNTKTTLIYATALLALYCKPLDISALNNP